MRFKSPLIFASKPSRYGDIICHLPFLTYLKKVYPNSYISFYIDKTCSSISPFLINYFFIDNLIISSETDRFNQNDLSFEYDIYFNPYSQLTRPDYYNFHGVLQENFIMTEIYGGGRIPKETYNFLTDEERTPKLSPYFHIQRFPKTIAIWPFSGYSQGNSIGLSLRSPSLQWWNSLVGILKGYNILQFGYPKSELINHPSIIDRRNLSLFDAVIESLGCDLVIGTDSGSQWIIGAYGHNQICLYTNYQYNHFRNLHAMVPTNSKGNIISLFGEKGINNILPEQVLENVKRIIN